MDYSSMLTFWVSALLLLSHARSQGHSESSEEPELEDQEAAAAVAADDESGRAARILGPRLISHVQGPNNGLGYNFVPSPQPQAVGDKTPQPIVGNVLHAVPVTFPNPNYGNNDPINVYPVQLPASHPIVASLDKNENAASTGVVTGYPVIVHIPDQHQPIAVYRGQFPAFIERILQRIQNRYSVYNPPEYFENRPRPEPELQPPEPPLCVEMADGEGRQYALQEGYAYAPPCPPTTTTTEAATTIAEGYAYEEPKPDNSTYNVFNGTIILINCTDLHPAETATPTATTSTPYVYPAPTTTTSTTTTPPPPPPVSGPYYYPPFAPPEEGELFIIPQKLTSSPPPPPPSIYLPPSTNPPPPPNTYLPPVTTTTTTTTTTPAPSYLPPETPKPSTAAPLYLPPETPKPPTPAPLYLPPSTPKPSTRAPLYIPPEPAPIYLPPKPVASTYLPPLAPSTTTKGPVSYAVSSAGKGQSAQPSNININIHGYQHTNQLQPLLPFPFRLLQFKKLLLAKLLNLN